MQKLIVIIAIFFIGFNIANSQYFISVNVGPNYSTIKQVDPIYYLWSTDFLLGGSSTVSINKSISSRFSCDIGFGYDLLRAEIEGIYGSKFESHRLDGNLDWSFLRLELRPRIQPIRHLNLDLISGLFTSHALNAQIKGKIDGVETTESIETEIQGYFNGFILGLGFTHSIGKLLLLSYEVSYYRTLSSFRIYNEYFVRYNYLVNIGLIIPLSVNN